MEKKLVVKGCPFLEVAHYAQGDTVEDQCGLTEYDLCADIEDCLLKQVARAVTEDDIKKCKELLQVKCATMCFRR